MQYLTDPSKLEGAMGGGLGATGAPGAAGAPNPLSGTPAITPAGAKK